MSNIQQKSAYEKIKKDPIPAFGMAGFFGVVGYALYNYRNKDKATKTSVYLLAYFLKTFKI
jgi:hypothetical protein